MVNIYSIIKVYSNIIVYQKYIGTCIKVGCATRSLYESASPKAEGVLSNLLSSTLHESNKETVVEHSLT